MTKVQDNSKLKNVFTLIGFLLSSDIWTVCTRKFILTAWGTRRNRSDKMFSFYYLVLVLVKVILILKRYSVIYSSATVKTLIFWSCYQKVRKVWMEMHLFCFLKTLFVVIKRQTRVYKIHNLILVCTFKNSRLININKFLNGSCNLAKLFGLMPDVILTCAQVFLKTIS